MLLILTVQLVTEIFILFMHRFSGGKPIKTGDYDALHEIAAICALCNDSSVDYNEVWFTLDILPRKAETVFVCVCVCVCVNECKYLMR